MKMLLISGHGAGDPGACANGYQEANLTIEVVQGMAAILKDKIDITIYPIENNAYADIQRNKLQVNFSQYDYVLEVHFNAGGGAGSEIYVTSQEKQTLVEQNIVTELSQYYKNRGVKVKDFLVIYNAKRKGTSSALLEVCFIDSLQDMQMYQSHKQEIYTAISIGIVKGFGLDNIHHNKSDAVSYNTVEYYPPFNNTSIIDGLKSINVQSDMATRIKIATKNNIQNYVGTAKQNTDLLSLAKDGKLMKV